MFPDPEWIAREHGKPAHISLAAWNLMEKVGLSKVPEGWTDEQLREYMNKEYARTHKTKSGRPIPLISPKRSD